MNRYHRRYKTFKEGKTKVVNLKMPNINCIESLSFIGGGLKFPNVPHISQEKIQEDMNFSVSHTVIKYETISLPLWTVFLARLKNK